MNKKRYDYKQAYHKEVSDIIRENIKIIACEFTKCQNKGGNQACYEERS